MPLAMFDRNGPPEAMTCPAIVCDYCGGVITGEGNVEWCRRKSERTFVTSPFYFTHKGCSRQCTSVLRRHYPHQEGWSAAWRDIGEFLAQLSFNFEHSFENDEDASYVAPEQRR